MYYIIYTDGFSVVKIQCTTIYRNFIEQRKQYKYWFMEHTLFWYEVCLAYIISYTYICMYNMYVLNFEIFRYKNNIKNYTLQILTISNSNLIKQIIDQIKLKIK